jgi:ferrochelatase
VEAFAQRIEEKLLEYPEARRKSVVLLFSAHSLPMMVVNRGMFVETNGRARRPSIHA